MKPIKLVMSGWGPYKEKVTVDFSKFENQSLFLITGQTGAGKTTIFDAITYALYGVLSGEVREKQTVRSDFATPETKTYVELTMVHQGKTYQIYRNPEYERPKKRGTQEGGMTKEKENASIDICCSDGELENIAAGATEVTRKVIDIMGMDAKQFRQISMIAQGEFAKMILASSQEKMVIFRQIFGTNIYANLKEELKRISSDLYRDHQMSCNRMNENIGLVSFEDEEFQTLISGEKLNYDKIFEVLSLREKEISDQAKALGKEEKDAEEALLLLQESLTKGRELNKDFQDLEKSKNELRFLEQNAEEIKELEGWLIRLKKAQTLVPVKQKLEYLKKDVSESEESIHKLKKEWEELQGQRQELELLYSYSDEIERGYELLQQLKDLEEKKSRLLESIAKQEEILKQRQDLYVTACENYEKEKQEYECADAVYKKAMIGIVAQMVVKGEPCPVCGSTEHPRVAKLQEQVLSEAELTALRKKCEALLQKRDAAFAKAQEAKQQSDSLKAQENDLQREADHRMLALKTFTEFAKETLEGMCKAEFSEKKSLYVKNESLCLAKKQQLEEVSKQLDVRKKDVAVAKTEYLSALETNGFDSEDAFLDILKQLDMLEEYEKRCASYHKRVAATQELCGHLEAKLKACKQVDLTAMEADFEVAATKRDDIKQRYRTVSTLHTNVKQAIAGMKNHLSECKKIQNEYKYYKDLAEITDGNNPKRLVFEQYVLASYFDEILRAANVRLYRMTGGRYELRRAKGVTDGRKKDSLEIVVMDFYTGKERSAKTLSGGETFKASLALALGMSDCIQARKGGIVVEALFIDEGFGALDEESLEQACNTLQQLAQNHRMIGIISHVPELRERIPNQIVIEKKHVGSDLSVIAV